MSAPHVFISYSWSSPTHENWVINLAERLVSDGVDVVIDKWDLKEGNDKFNFMESMVKANEINKVLIILDKKYAYKADKRSGGVGTETQIISPQVYTNVSQEKFIPIVSEKDDKGKAFVPTYLEGRIYIDLSEPNHYEQNYEALLRNIYQRPAYNKPKLGKAPTYLFEENQITYRTTSILRSFDNQIDKNPKKANSLIRDFLEEFFQNLKSYSIANINHDEIIIGKEVFEKITSYTPLRNDFISFFDKLTNAEIHFDIDIVIKFLEKLPVLLYPQDNKGSWSDYEFDNFRFYIHELFLYLITIGIKNENYKFVAELLYSSYFIYNKYDYKNEPQSFHKFNHNCGSINRYYNQIYSQKFFNPAADLMIKRIPENFTMDIFVEADLLCHYVGVLNNIDWFPITYVYKTRGKFELFNRLVSARHFEKTKLLYNVQNVKELQDKLLEIKTNDKNPDRMRYSNSFDTVINIYKMINIETIATAR
jgi:hypothetical protein